MVRVISWCHSLTIGWGSGGWVTVLAVDVGSGPGGWVTALAVDVSSEGCVITLEVDTSVRIWLENKMWLTRAIKRVGNTLRV